MGRMPSAMKVKDKPLFDTESSSTEQFLPMISANPLATVRSTTGGSWNWKGVGVGAGRGGRGGGPVTKRWKMNKPVREEEK